MARVYLDVCCLNRPLDDARQPRILQEARAVSEIVARLRMREWEWISSDVVDLEISKSPDPERRWRVQLLVSSAHHRIIAGDQEFERAGHIRSLGFSPLDALHLACAESGEAHVFLTTDDRLLHLANRGANDLRVAARNPLAWLQEMTANGHDTAY